MIDKILQYRNQIALTIFLGDSDPYHAARAIGITPERIAVRGSRRNDKVVIPRQSYVTYRSQSENWEASLADHWINLKNKIGSKIPTLQEISRNSYTKITIIYEYFDPFQRLDFSREFLQFSHQIDAVIDVDTYDDREDADDSGALDTKHPYHLNFLLNFNNLTKFNVENVLKFVKNNDSVKADYSSCQITIRTQPHHGWGSSYEQHWECLKGVFLPQLNVLQQLSRNSETTLKLLVEDISRFPVIFIEQDFIKFVNDINAALVIDTLKE